MKQLLISCFFALLAFPLFAQSNDAGHHYLFILDASGSMWQKLGPDYKIVAAKKVMKDLAQKLPADARVGLIAYGHQRKSDCDDIETLVPLATLDKAAFSAKIDAINPQGKTPIAKSILHALALLRPEKQPVTVILVSDGLETCDGDACDLVKQAKEQGAKITLHVVGFGMEELDISALECIAQAGNGQYIPVDNAGELMQAMEKTLEPPVLDGGYLSIKATLEGKPMDATVQVFKKGEKKELTAGRTYTGPATNPRVLLLPAGVYRVEVAAIALDERPVQVLEDISITHHDTLRKEVDFAQSTVEILITRNGALSDAVVRLYKSGTKEVTSQTRSYAHAQKNPVKFSVLPGIYDVEISSVEIEGKPVVKMEKQVMKSGGALKLAHHFKSGELKVGAVQGSALVDATINIYTKKGRTNVANGRTYQSAGSNPKTFILEPGEYEVLLTGVKPAGLGKKTMNVTVTEKGTAELTGNW